MLTDVDLTQTVARLRKKYGVTRVYSFEEAAKQIPKDHPTVAFGGDGIVLFEGNRAYKQLFPGTHIDPFHEKKRYYFHRFLNLMTKAFPDRFNLDLGANESFPIRFARILKATVDKEMPISAMETIPGRKATSDLNQLYTQLSLTRDGIVLDINGSKNILEHNGCLFCLEVENLRFPVVNLIGFAPAPVQKRLIASLVQGLRFAKNQFGFDTEIPIRIAHKFPNYANIDKVLAFPPKAVNRQVA
jgi:hypothetical protein